jgi:WD40 repeat protein
VTWPAQRAAIFGQFRTLAIAPDSAWLATGAADGTVRIWDAATGQEHTAFHGHHGPVRAVGIARDGTWLVTAADGAMQVWDTFTGQESVPHGSHYPDFPSHEGRFNAVAVAADGTWVAAAAAGGFVRIWDTATGQQRTALSGHNGEVHAVAVAPDDTWLVTAEADGSVRIWDTATGQERGAVYGAVSAVAASPDGTWLATGSEDGSVKVSEVTTGRCVAAMRVDGEVHALCWLLNEGLAVAGAGGLYVFDFLSRPLPLDLSVPKQTVEGLGSFSGPGRERHSRQPPSRTEPDQGLIN